MKIHDICEGVRGVVVIKNLDGKEKRFRDANSKEAQAWKASSNAKYAAYSDQYWDDKEVRANDYTFVTPWRKIGHGSTDQIEQIIQDHFGGVQADWSMGPSSEITIDGTTCAARTIRVTYELGPDDDMGSEGFAQESQTIVVARDRQQPKKINLISY